jgi:aspartate kinase
LIVMKFGGTSVASAERVSGVALLVRERLSRRPVVVTSALAGVTDLLIRGARLALKRDTGAEDVLGEIRDRHVQVMDALVPEGVGRDDLRSQLERVVGELGTLYKGVHYLEELTPRSLDAISAMGERLSFPIVRAALEMAGVRAHGVDARGIIVTDESFGRALPLMEETADRVREHIRPLVENDIVPVLGGYMASTREGVTTTLGRGGSDWSAAILGALLPAEEIQIWTDVDGMLTVDPRAVEAARPIPEVSFEEAAELAYFGAKVLHPATIKPAVERGIPVLILNSMRADAGGTRVTSDAAPAPEGARAIAFKKGITVVLISQPRMLMAHGFLARVFEVFDRHKTSVDLIATSEVSVSLTVDDPARIEPITGDLRGLGEVQVLRAMAIVSIVGRGFVKRPGLAGRIFQALREVNVVMISFGASDVNISMVVTEHDAERAVRLLHREFFEGARA